MIKTKQIKGSRIHNEGPKADRDRLRIIRKYDELCKFAKIKRLPPSDIAKLTNIEFYKLCEDSFNALPFAKKRKYAEYVGISRKNPKALKWFWKELDASGVGFFKKVFFVIKNYKNWKSTK